MVVALLVALICVYFVGLIEGDVESNGTASIFIHPPHKGTKLEKQIFNSQSRLIFVAGLEGMGHHMWKDMFSVCLANSKCEKEPVIGAAAMRYDIVKQMNFGLFGTAGSNDIAKQVATIETRMRELLAIPGDHLYFIGLNSHHGSGMMSYPNFDARDKAIDNPDIFALAMIAESIGFDFRVIVLQRKGEDVAASVKKRNFAHFVGSLGGMGESRIQMAAATTLYAQLSLLDRKFYECVQFSELHALSDEKKQKLTDFIHPTNMKETFTEMLKKIRPPKTTTVQSRRLAEDEDNKQEESGRRRLLGLSDLSQKYHNLHLSHRLELIDELCASQ